MIDIEKLIESENNKFTDDLMTEKYSYLYRSSVSESAQNATLSQCYAEQLLASYHEALKSELAKQGIKI